MQKQLISLNIEENEKAVRQAFSDCDDLKVRKLSIGKNGKVRGFVCYIEVNAGNNMVNVLGRMIAYLEGLPDEQIAEAVAGNAFALSDATPYEYMEDAILGILIGDSVLFVDGVARALKIPDQGYPKMGVS